MKKIIIMLLAVSLTGFSAPKKIFKSRQPTERLKRKISQLRKEELT